jgi:hypothetical protein
MDIRRKEDKMPTTEEKKGKVEVNRSGEDIKLLGPCDHRKDDLTTYKMKYPDFESALKGRRMKLKESS